MHPTRTRCLSTCGSPAEHITKGTDELPETKDIEIYGEPSDTVLDQSGVPIVVKPRHLAGFTRASG